MGARNSIVTTAATWEAGESRYLNPSAVSGEQAQGCSLLPIEGGLLGCTTRGTRAPLGPAISLADALVMRSGKTTQEATTTSQRPEASIKPQEGILSKAVLPQPSLSL